MTGDPDKGGDSRPGFSIEEAAAELETVRDILRFAVSRFSRAGLVYGHGTETPLDEAAFLVLAGLDLPIDELAPWLDARLTLGERRHLLGLVARRIATRKPAPYLVGAAWIGPYRFKVDERVIVPRSFIGELLLGGLADMIAETTPVERVLDLCCGSGCLAILSAIVFPEAEVVAADISADALAVAEENVRLYGLGNRIRLVRSDLFGGLAGERFDVIVCNPPYVTEAAVAAFPPEYAAEPVLAHLGGADGLDLVHRILACAGQHLNQGGTLLCEVGQEREALEAAYPRAAFEWLDTENSSGEVFRLGSEALPV